MSGNPLTPDGGAFKFQEPTDMDEVISQIRQILTDDATPTLELTEEMLVSAAVTPLPKPTPSPPASEVFTVTRVHNGWIAVSVGENGQKIGKAFVATTPDQLASLMHTWGVSTQDL